MALDDQDSPALAQPWELALPELLTESMAQAPPVPLAPAQPTAMPLAVRMNNPLNIKVGAATQKWIDTGQAEPGARAQDGGRFLHFASPQVGMQAAEDLLTGPNYRNLTLDRALQKWSNKGYGGEIVQGVDPQTKVSALSPQQLSQTMEAMRVKEGGYTFTRAEAPQARTSAPTRQPRMTQDTTGQIGATPPPMSLSQFMQAARTAQGVGGGASTPPFQEPAWASAREGEGIPTGTVGLEYGGGAARYTPTRENDAAFVQSLATKPKGGPFEGIGTIPLLIGLIAAGNGQFGPLAAMMEQTRKTQQAATMQPLLTEISRRQGKGDYAGALQLGEIGFGALEGRAPEAAKDLATTLQSIRKGRNELEGLRTTLNTISDSMSQNHPSYAIIQNLRKQADQGSWQSAEAMRDTLKKALDVQIYTGPNGTTAVSPLQPDKPMQVHLKQWFTADDMKGWKGQQLQSEVARTNLGPLSPDEIINIVNHDAQPILKNGVDINTPANAQVIRILQNRIAADEALMDVSNRTPMSSETHDMLIAAGVTEDQIRHRADGAIPPEKYQEVFARRQQMAEATGAGAARAQWEAQLDMPTALSEKLAVIKNDDGTIMQDMNARQGYADNKHFSVVPKQNAYKINQYTLALNQMGDFEKMMKDQDLPSLDETGARVKQYVHGILQRYIPTDAAFTGRQVGQAILGGLLDETLLPEKGQVEPYRQKLQQLYDHPELMTKEQLSTTLGAVRMALQRRKDQLMIQGPDTAGMQPAPAAETIPELKPPPPIAPSREQAKPNQWHRAP